jgi:hypothetical protein
VIELKAMTLERERKRKRPNQSQIDNWQAEISALERVREKLTGGNDSS